MKHEHIISSETDKEIEDLKECDMEFPKCPEVCPNPFSVCDPSSCSIESGRESILKMRALKEAERFFARPENEDYEDYEPNYDISHIWAELTGAAENVNDVLLDVGEVSWVDEEIADLNQRITKQNHDRMVVECKRLNRDVLILTNENRELRGRIAELEDQLALEKRWGVARE